MLASRPARPPSRRSEQAKMSPRGVGLSFRHMARTNGPRLRPALWVRWMVGQGPRFVRQRAALSTPAAPRTHRPDPADPHGRSGRCRRPLAEARLQGGKVGLHPVSAPGVARRLPVETRGLLQALERTQLVQAIHVAGADLTHRVALPILGERAAGRLKRVAPMVRRRGGQGCRPPASETYPAASWAAARRQLRPYRERCAILPRRCQPPAA